MTREATDHWFGDPRYEGSEHPLALVHYATPDREEEEMEEATPLIDYADAAETAERGFALVRGDLTDADTIELLDALEGLMKDLLVHALGIANALSGASRDLTHHERKA